MKNNNQRIITTMLATAIATQAIVTAMPINAFATGYLDENLSEYIIEGDTSSISDIIDSNEYLQNDDATVNTPIEYSFNDDATVETPDEYSFNDDATVEDLSDYVNNDDTTVELPEDYANSDDVEVEEVEIIDTTNFTFNFDTQTITAYTGEETRVVIPQYFVDEDGSLVEAKIIGTDAFRYNEIMTSVVIPNSIVEIKTYAFSYCTNLIDIKLSNNLETIGANAFRELIYLESIEIPSLKTMDGSVFRNCTSLKTIVMPEGFEEFTTSYAFRSSSVEEISLPSTTIAINGLAFGPSDSSKVENIYINQFVEETVLATDSDWGSNANVAFLDSGTFTQGDYTYDIASKTIIEYTGNESNLVIPSQFIANHGNVYTVENLGESLFEDNIVLTTVNLPDTLKTIGVSAFKNCTSLVDVNLSLNLETISDNAFYNCSSLQNIAIPSVKFIGTEAFYGTTSITKMVLPEGFEGFTGRYPFEYSGLVELYLPSTTKEVTGLAVSSYRSNVESVFISMFIDDVSWGYDYKFGVGANVCYYDYGIFTQGDWTYNIGTKTITEYLGDDTHVVIPSEFTVFDGYLFIPEILGTRLFNRGTAESYEIPNSIIKMETGVFNSNDNLREIRLPDNLVEIDSSLFTNCESLEKIEIPSLITITGNNNFGGIDSLKELVLPEGLVSIEDNQGFYYAAIEDIYIPSTVTYMDSNTFGLGNTYKTKNVFINQYTYETELDVTSNYGASTTCNIVYLDKGTFTQGDWEYDIETKTIIGYTGSETNLVIPQEFSVWESVSYTVEHISPSIFANNTDLISVTMPNSVKTIGNYAFQNCTNLVYIKMSTTLETIGEYAFSGCTSLADLEIPSVRTIGNYAFATTTSLTKLTLPEGFETFAANVFRYSGVTEVYLPSTLVTMPTSVFGSANNLTMIYINQYIEDATVSKTSSFGSSACVAFLDSGTLLQGDWVYNIATKTIEEYLGSDENVVIPSEFYVYGGVSTQPEILEKNLFKSNTDMVTLVMPDSIKTIGYTAFYGCTNLVDIKMSANLETIEGYAFRDCTSLVELYIPSVKTIDLRAFQSVPLQTLVLPEGFEEFTGAMTFYKTELEELYLPTTFKSITSTGLQYPDTLKAVYINQYKSETELDTNTKWGSTTATVYWLNENISKDYEMKASEEGVVVVITATTEGGEFKTITLPNGDIVEISGSEISYEYLATSNDLYSFVLELTDGTTENVFVNVTEVGNVYLESEKSIIELTPEEASVITKATIIDLAGAYAYDELGNSIEIEITEEMISQIHNADEQTRVNLIMTATNENSGKVISKTITVSVEAKVITGIPSITISERTVYADYRDLNSASVSDVVALIGATAEDENGEVVEITISSEDMDVINTLSTGERYTFIITAIHSQSGQEDKEVVTVVAQYNEWGVPIIYTDILTVYLKSDQVAELTEEILLEKIGAYSVDENGNYVKVYMQAVDVEKITSLQVTEKFSYLLYATHEESGVTTTLAIQFRCEDMITVEFVWEESGWTQADGVISKNIYVYNENSELIDTRIIVDEMETMQLPEVPENYDRWHAYTDSFGNIVVYPVMDYEIVDILDAEGELIATYKITRGNSVKEYTEDSKITTEYIVVMNTTIVTLGELPYGYDTWFTAEVSTGVIAKPAKNIQITDSKGNRVTVAYVPNTTITVVRPDGVEEELYFDANGNIVIPNEYEFENGWYIEQDEEGNIVIIIRPTEEDNGNGNGGTVNPDEGGNGSGGTVDPDEEGNGSGGTVNPDEGGNGSGGTVNPDDEFIGPVPDNGNSGNGIVTVIPPTSGTGTDGSGADFDEEIEDVLGETDGLGNDELLEDGKGGVGDNNTDENLIPEGSLGVYDTNGDLIGTVEVPDGSDIFVQGGDGNIVGKLEPTDGKITIPDVVIGGVLEGWYTVVDEDGNVVFKPIITAQQ